ncbi:hypothetical protein KCU81_g342, partial [Aureobasidium melanogenum]
LSLRTRNKAPCKQIRWIVSLSVILAFPEAHLSNQDVQRSRYGDICIICCLAFSPARRYSRLPPSPRADPPHGGIPHHWPSSVNGRSPGILTFLERAWGGLLFCSWSDPDHIYTCVKYHVAKLTEYVCQVSEVVGGSSICDEVVMVIKVFAVAGHTECVICDTRWIRKDLKFAASAFEAETLDRQERTPLTAREHNRRTTSKLISIYSDVRSVCCYLISFTYFTVEVTDKNNDRSTRNISMATPECAELLLVAILVQNVYLSNFIEFGLGRKACLVLFALLRFIVRHGACPKALEYAMKRSQERRVDQQPHLCTAS